MFRSCLSSLLLVSIVGCSGSSGPALYSVIGTLTRGGQPVAGVTVTFTPVDGGPSSAGRTSENGKFALVSQTGKAGAVAGTHKVTVSKPQVASTSGDFDMSNPAFQEAMMKQRESANDPKNKGKIVEEKASSDIPAEYSDPLNTPLEYTVESGANEFDIVIP